MHTHPTFREYALVHRALGNERRLFLLRLLAIHKMLTNAQLVSLLRIAEPSVSRHLHVLIKAGFVIGTRKGMKVEFQLGKSNWVMKYMDFFTD